MNKVKLSKFMSLVLRHKPEVIGLKIDGYGWAHVDELIALSNKNGKPLTLSLLKEIVETDNKQRYSFSDDGVLIRANQGHSINIDLCLEAVKPLDLLYHGTASKYVKLIKAKGIKSQTRQFVHLSDNVDTATDVGKRHGWPVILTINAKQMYEDGYNFYLSENGVWLVEEVPKEYIN